MAQKLLIVFLVFGLITQFSYYHFTSPVDKLEGGYEYWDMSVLAHENNCIATGTGIKFKVNVEFDEELLERNNALAKWYNQTNTLRIKRDADVDTIAHEASHIVDDFLKQYRIKEPHYRAYAQGAWTQCVYDIVHR